MTPVLEVMTVANGGDEGRGGDGTYTLTGLRAAGEFVVAHSETNLPFILQHLSGQPLGVFEQIPHAVRDACRQNVDDRRYPAADVLGAVR